MAIRQEKRVGAPHPDVQETDYGATFVKAAVESPVVKEEAVVEQEPAAVSVEPVAVRKKRGGRPKKKA